MNSSMHFVFVCFALSLTFTQTNAQRSWGGSDPRDSDSNYPYDPSGRRPLPGDPYYRPPPNSRDPYRDSGIGGGLPRRRPNENDVGDRRCPGAVAENLELKVSVDILGSGVVNGRLVYLCDGPEIPEHGRPKSGRPITNFYKNVSVFLGIPYAEPPIYANDLRFKPPKVKSAWGIVTADRYMPACPQNVRYYGEYMGVDRVDEDCLYLNIFTPTAKRGLYKKFPVMIYIHGGNWDHGSSNSYPAHMLSASQEVVVVTFNYRLGALGFLATGDSDSPGNYGLLDQSMAIQWVFERIEYFNGDPQLITLFGPGAGGASAGLHLLSPKTADVVSGVIAQSGSALADWAFISDPTYMYNSSRIFGRAVGCTTYSSYELVECLKSRSTADIMTIERKPEVGWLLWGPVLDNITRQFKENDRFFPKSTLDLLNEIPNFREGTAYMGGVTRDEAVAMLLDDEDLKKNRFEITREIFNKKIMQYMKMYNYTLNPDAVFNAINFMYSDFAGPDNMTLLRQGYIDMLSDSYYKAPNDKFLKKLIEKGVKTYMYVLNYTLEGRTQPEWHGVPHDTEFYLSTGAPFMDHNFYARVHKMDSFKWTEGDRNMSMLLMQAWANFAKEGNPTPHALFNTIRWQPMTANNLQYLSLNTTNLTSIMLRDYRQKECQFWSEYLPTLIDKVMPTWPPIIEPWEMREKRVYTGALFGMVGAAILFIFLTLLCSCLYCNAKRYDSY